MSHTAEQIRANIATLKTSIAAEELSLKNTRKRYAKMYGMIRISHLGIPQYFYEEIHDFIDIPGYETVSKLRRSLAAEEAALALLGD